MKMTYVYIALIVVVIGGVVFAKSYSTGTGSSRVTAYDGFAQCLSDAGAKFYGAFWCPHCRNQKSMFDNSTKIPYIECSTPNGQAQTQVCTDAGVDGYPTWEFADGSRLDGERSLTELGEKTGCEVPVV